MTLLYLPRWVEVLIALYRLPADKRYLQQLYRVAPGSSSHIKELMKAFQKHGLVRVKKTEYIHFLVLTQQGAKLGEQLTQARWTLLSLDDPVEDMPSAG